MSCEVSSLPFLAQANYGTWSIDFDLRSQNCSIEQDNTFFQFDGSESLVIFGIRVVTR